MKRGEVVDAETAVKIIQQWQSASSDWDGRAVIWPLSRAAQAILNTHKVNLAEYPCRRSLLHLVCLPDRICMVMAKPFFEGDRMDYDREDVFFSGYGIQAGWVDASYDDGLNLSIKGHCNFGLFLENKIDWVKAEKQFHRKGLDSWQDKITILDEALDSSMLNKERLGLLHVAIALEQFAFSPRTSFKRREPSKQTMNRNPSLKQWPPIEIINLRLPEKKENPDSKGRELTIRFYVKGHLRRQWRPSTKDHKLIWIDEHIRGPKDAPLKPKPTKVYKVTR